MAQEGEQRKEHDKQQIAGMLHEELATDVGNSMLMLRRLGKQEETKQFRPILVKLSSIELREKLLRMNKYLKERNQANNTKFRIDPDLTKQQQENLKAFYDKANKMNKNESKNGVFHYVLGKESPRIVEIIRKNPESQ